MRPDRLQDAADGEHQHHGANHQPRRKLDHELEGAVWHGALDHGLGRIGRVVENGYVGSLGKPLKGFGNGEVPTFSCTLYRLLRNVSPPTL
jgi:hypothetical protein